MATQVGELDRKLVGDTAKRVSSSVENLRTGVHEFVVDADLGSPGRLQVLVREYRRLAQLISLAESLQVAALLGFKAADIWYSRKLDELARETGWADLELVVVASQNRFQSDVELGITYMPARRPSLLPLSALAHELGHHAIRAWGGIEQSTHDAIRERLRAAADWSSLDTDAQSIVTTSWSASWTEEFLCDAYATLTLGGPYLWFLLAVVVALHEDPYRPRGSLRGDHPAPAIRIESARRILSRVGLSDPDFDTIWEGYRAPFGPPGEAYGATYLAALPTVHDRAFADAKGHGLGVRAAGVKPGGLVAAIEESWARFRADPAAFMAWQENWLAAAK